MSDDKKIEKFVVSDSFAQFEANNAAAVQAAREAEVRTLGINLPVGTMGSCTIIDCNAKTSKQVTDDKGVVKGGNPMVTMAFEVSTPEDKKGHKFYRNFIFNHHEKYSAAQKYADWLDFMEKAGLPREIRAASTAAIIKWCAEAARSFLYEVVHDEYGDDQKRNVQPQVGTSNTLPTPTATSAALQATGSGTTSSSSSTPSSTPTSTVSPPETSGVPSKFQLHDMVKFAGSDFMVSKIDLADGKIEITNPATNRALTVDGGQCRPA